MDIYGIVALNLQWFIYACGSWTVQILILLASLWSHYNDDCPQGPASLKYDYVIVGAGTAGSLIFNQMPPQVSVLLIEAGSEGGYQFTDIPIVSPTLQRTSMDWSYITEPQTNACQAMKHGRCILAAGRGHGGSNLLNNMIYYRGNENDFRGWFHDPKDYDYEEQILPLFREMERELNPNQMLHRTEFGQTFDNLVLTNTSVGGEVAFYTPRVLQRHGFRRNMAHLVRERNTSKLHRKLYNAMVTKILFNENQPDRISALEVHKNSKIFHIAARKGFVLSLGAIGTPTLLLRSGIGPCNELAKHSLQCQHDLASVGKNLQDHLATGMDLITLNTSLNVGLAGLLSPTNIYRYFFQQGQQSLWSTVGCESLGFFHHSEYQTNGRPALGFMVIPMGLASDMGACLKKNLNIDPNIWSNYFEPLVAEQTVSVIPILLQPKSRGQVTLASPDFTKSPIVDPRYLTHPDDMRVLKAGIDILRNDLVKADKLGRFNATITSRPVPGCEQFEFQSDDYWECYIRHISFSVYHLGGTCRIGDPASPETVVDRADFRVKGLDNLFVADASVMPNMPSGNSNAAVALVAQEFMRRLIERMEAEGDLSSDSNVQEEDRKVIDELSRKNEL